MLRSLFLTLLLTAPAFAGAPRVVTDIAPVHGLVARIMQGVADPVLLLPPGVSPHHYALRPSDARALQRADLVVWIGPALTPWLEKPLGSLAGAAGKIALLDVAGSRVLRFESAAEEGDAHDHGGNHEGDDGHDGGLDPHAWLDPRIARLWVDAIAAGLAEADSGNAATYIRNARAARKELAALDAEIAALVEPVRKVPFVTFHDAYRYFEDRYGLTNVGTVMTGDAGGAGAAGLAALRDQIERRGAVCAFSEPQFDPALLQAAGERADIRLAVLDPMGMDLAPGPAFYPALLRQMATALAACLAR